LTVTVLLNCYRAHFTVLYMFLNEDLLSEMFYFMFH